MTAGNGAEYAMNLFWISYTVTVFISIVWPGLQADKWHGIVKLYTLVITLNQQISQNHAIFNNSVNYFPFLTVKLPVFICTDALHCHLYCQKFLISYYVSISIHKNCVYCNDQLQFGSKKDSSSTRPLLQPIKPAKEAMASRMLVKHTTKFCIMACLRNYLSKMYQ